MVSETGAKAGLCFACSACSWSSLNSSDMTLFSHDFHDDAFVTLAIKFRIENSLPGSEIKFAGCDRHDTFMMNEQRLQVRVAVVLAGFMVLGILTKWGKVLKPLINVLDESTLVVVNIYSGGDVHRRNQHHAFLHSAATDNFFDLRREMDVRD